MTPKIFTSLFVDKAVTLEDLEAAQAVYREMGEDTPIWIRALAGGNPKNLGAVWNFVVEEFCREQLWELGYQVKLEKRPGGDER